jgi:hypothetical protein
MRQTCNDEYWRYMQKLKPADAPCGQSFDDATHSTLCPHEELAPAELMIGIDLDRINAERAKRDLPPLTRPL